MITVFTVTSRNLKKFLEKCFSLNCSTMERFESVSDWAHAYRLKNIKEFIPKVTSNLHKGQCGRIGIIGGSFEYTGAPYFAAMSALRVGVDVVHVFCCREAGPVIKSYSPELIVHPFLDGKGIVSRIQPWLERLDSVVIGPGMGRDPDMLKNVADIIKHCKANMSNPPSLIIDADGLYLIAEDLTLIKGYPGPIFLSPNRSEFARLSEKMGEKDALMIAGALNAVIVQKGLLDAISNGMHDGEFNSVLTDLILKCEFPGTNRRCAGQGDVLAGCLAAFVAWLQIHFSRSSGTSLENVDFVEEKKGGESRFRDTFLPYSWAAYGACVITRTASRMAFEENGRGMTASDMLTKIPAAFKSHFNV